MISPISCLLAVAVMLVTLINPVCAVTFELDAAGAEPLYQTRLPKAVYQFSQSNRLQDLVITNAAGEQVPYALMTYPQLFPTSLNDIQKPLDIYPLQQNSLNNSDELLVQVEKNTVKTTLKLVPKDLFPSSEVVFLLDNGGQSSALDKITLEWQGSEGKLLAFDILAGDGLNNWLLVGSDVLLKSHYNGHALLQDTLHLEQPTAARYIQLRPKNPLTLKEFVLTKAMAIYRAAQHHEPALDWATFSFIGREEDHQAGRINLTYESPGHYPVSHVQIKLPQDNTITTVNISVRNTTQESWRYLAQGALFQIVQQGKGLSSPNLVFASTIARYWQLQFNQANGGLGVGNPILQAGWQPDTVIWNARGHAPFTLHVGENQRFINTLPLASLLPDRLAQAAHLPEAVIIENIKAQATLENAWAAPTDYKRWLLWGGLLLGVLLLAGMAYGLIRNGRAP